MKGVTVRTERNYLPGAEQPVWNARAGRFVEEVSA